MKEDTVEAIKTVTVCVFIIPIIIIPIIIIGVTLLFFIPKDELLWDDWY